MNHPSDRTEVPRCRNCRRPLPVKKLHEWEGATPTTERYIGYGHDSDGTFCTLRCGYKFGLEAARKEAE